MDARLPPSANAVKKGRPAPRGRPILPTQSSKMTHHNVVMAIAATLLIVPFTAAYILHILHNMSDEAAKMFISVLGMATAVIILSSITVLTMPLGSATHLAEPTQQSTAITHVSPYHDEAVTGNFMVDVTVDRADFNAGDAVRTYVVGSNNTTVQVLDGELGSGAGGTDEYVRHVEEEEMLYVNASQELGLVTYVTNESGGGGEVLDKEHTHFQYNYAEYSAADSGDDSLVFGYDFWTVVFVLGTMAAVLYAVI